MEKYLELVNYEGPCLKMARVPNDPDKFVIYDQWDYTCEILSLRELCDWLEGKMSVCDSKGKEWYYPQEHEEAKPNLYKIIKWIYTD